MKSDPTGHWVLRAISADIGAAAFGGIAYFVGKAMRLRGKNLAVLTAGFALLGAIFGVMFGLKILQLINQFLKPVLYFFNSRLCYIGVRLFGVLKVMIHAPHPKEGIGVHIQIEILTRGVWRVVFKYVFWR